MQRADKIALIVASVLVVLLSAGAGVLLYKRSTTIAAERPADGSVKLTSIEDTASLPPEPTATPAARPQPSVPTRPDGSDGFGFVTLVGSDGGDVYIKWDQADLLTGSAADVYAKKNGAVVNTELYYIANDTKKNKTYDLSPSAKIVYYEADGTTATIAPGEFDKRWNAGGPVRKRPWWLFIERGDVVRLEQVVLPENPSVQ